MILYSPRTAYPDGEPLQAFTAIGTVATGDVYQVEVTSHFKPHRVDVQFVPSKEAQIKPLVGRLSFIKSQSHWGAAFRFGSVEIPGSDFALIAERMGAAPLAEYARSMGGGVGCQSAGPSQPRCTSKLACDKLSVLMAPRSRPVISTVKSNECSTEIMAESIHRRP